MQTTLSYRTLLATLSLSAMTTLPLVGAAQASPMPFDPADPSAQILPLDGAAAPLDMARRGRGADDGPGHIRGKGRGRGADDGPGHIRGKGRGRGADDGPNHT